ncbi:MAG: DUF1073 domain-containing protein [Patescibacteria group bacterium]|nr:DUF1073 domain-containing protein [Patescibacteria group bacterium]
MNLLRRWRRDSSPAPTESAQSSAADRDPIRISQRFLESLVGEDEAQKQKQFYNSPWEPRRYPPGVLPKGATLAMDAAVGEGLNWASGFHGLWAEGIGFLGYPYLAELTQRPEYRRPCEILAEEMTRKWIRLRATGDDDKSDKIRILDAEMTRFNLREKFHDAILLNEFFGLSFLYVDVGTSDDAEEQKTPLTLTPAKIGKGSLKAFTLIDPTWTAPNWFEAARPWRQNFYKPDTWFLMGQVTHRSRLLITVGRPVPDILKPGYNFGGIATTQLLKPYVDNWLRTRQSVSDLIWAFTVFVLATDMSDMFSGGGDAVAARAQAFVKMRNNLGLMTLDKDREEFQNVSAPLSGLDHLQAQAQEHMAAVVGEPLIKMFGITPSGLNATADNEVRVFYDMIHARQERVMNDNISTALKILQLNRFGEIDPEIEHEFVPLWQLDEAGQAAVQKTKADAAAVYIESGVIAPEEERRRVAADPESPWHGLEGPPPEPPEEPEKPDLSDPTERIDNKAEEGSESGANSGA